ncbi:hypothetical protein AAVH_25983 [Aphelenchoides avenae]|nr:hypothetical protein AAVH_25983 [Aphelenchus avenae]
MNKLFAFALMCLVACVLAEETSVESVSNEEAGATIRPRRHSGYGSDNGGRFGNGRFGQGNGFAEKRFGSGNGFGRDSLVLTTVALAAATKMTSSADAASVATTSVALGTGTSAARASEDAAQAVNSAETTIRPRRHSGYGGENGGRFGNGRFGQGNGFAEGGFGGGGNGFGRGQFGGSDRGFGGNDRNDRYGGRGFGGNNFGGFGGRG